MIEIGISVKAERWRTNDRDALIKDLQFTEAKAGLLSRMSDESGLLSCQGCGAFTRTSASGSTAAGLTEQGFFECHHISGDHGDNSQGNLAMLCPFCHAPFHIGFNCAQDNGCLVYAPEIAQSDISRIAFVSAVFFNRIDNEHITKIKAVYTKLATRRTLVDDLLGADAGVRVANEILKIARDASEVGSMRRAALPRLLSPLRYLPYIEIDKVLPAVRYWRKRVYDGAGPTADGIKSWSRFIQQAIPNTNELHP
jgi:hypothetical protein